MTNARRRRQTRSRLMTGMDPIRHNERVRLNKLYRVLSRRFRVLSLITVRLGREMSKATEAFHE